MARSAVLRVESRAVKRDHRREAGSARRKRNAVGPQKVEMKRDGLRSRIWTRELMKQRRSRKNDGRVCWNGLVQTLEGGRDIVSNSTRTESEVLQINGF